MKRPTLEAQKELARRMCRLHGLACAGFVADYRYWQLRKCGFNPHDGAVWSWWVGLHYLDRVAVVRLSMKLRAEGVT